MDLGESTAAFDVIVVHTFRMDLTKTCLDSIPDDHAVFLVDNSVIGEARSYAEGRRNITYTRMPYPTSFAKSVNTAAFKSRSCWLLISNNDILYSPNSWRALRTLVEVSGVDLYTSECGWSSVLVRAEVYNQLKLDESFEPVGGEDEDFMIRFTQAGFKHARRNFGIFHMDGGHNSRTDNYKNIKLIKEKHGFERPEEWKKVIATSRI